MTQRGAIVHTPPTTEEAMEQLAAEFPGWRFWCSQDGDSPGELMATRRRDLTDAEVAAGLARTLPMGHNADLLRAQLAEQARLEDAMGGPA